MNESADKPRAKRNWRDDPRKRKKLKRDVFLAISLARLLTWTCRAQTFNAKLYDPLRTADPQTGQPMGVIAAVWHGSHVPMLFSHRGHRVCIMTSQSADGEILSRVLESQGYKTVRGSSSSSGARAALALIDTLREGYDAVLAVDGPRGPACKVKPGIMTLAKRTGCPIYPLACASTWQLTFKSWDRMRLPLPLSRSIVVSGRPMWVPPDSDNQTLEQMRVELEQDIILLQAQADEAVSSRRASRELIASCNDVIGQVSQPKWVGAKP